jgi:hypothetical protein
MDTCQLNRLKRSLKVCKVLKASYFGWYGGVALGLTKLHISTFSMELFAHGLNPDPRGIDAPSRRHLDSRRPEILLRKDTRVLTVNSRNPSECGLRLEPARLHSIQSWLSKNRAQTHFSPVQILADPFSLSGSPVASPLGPPRQQILEVKEMEHLKNKKLKYKLKNPTRGPKSSRAGVNIYQGKLCELTGTLCLNFLHRTPVPGPP